jgi:hypothetical protein
VLGLVSTKVPDLESVNDLLRRIDEASRYVPMERLALSPQCGFASDYRGDPISQDDQWRKLELVSSVAQRLGGRSGTHRLSVGHPRGDARSSVSRSLADAGGESQQWLIHLTNPHEPFDEAGAGNGARSRDRSACSLMR